MERMLYYLGVENLSLGESNLQELLHIVLHAY